MQTLAVTFYNVVVWLHISSVVLAFGPTFAFGIYVALAQTPKAGRFYVTCQQVQSAR